MTRPMFDPEVTERFARAGENIRRRMEKALRELDEALRRQRISAAEIRATIEPSVYLHSHAQIQRSIAQRHLTLEVRRVRAELGLPNHPFDGGYYDGPLCDYTSGGIAGWCGKIRDVHES